MEKRDIAILSDKELSGLARRVAIQVAEHRGERPERVRVVTTNVTQFANGEIYPMIPETLRGLDVFLFFGFSLDPNVRLMELFLTIDALQRAGVQQIILVLPYMPYLRQDRKDKPRVPISARVIADLIESFPRVRQIITLDMHCQQEQGFFKISVDNLAGMKIHAPVLRSLIESEARKYVIVSPDFGGAERVRLLSQELGELPVGVLQKRRTGANRAETLHYIGEKVRGKDIILYDDMVDTGGSAISSLEFLLNRGARSVTLCATHGIFSAKDGITAESRFRGKEIRVITTESIPRSEEYITEHAEWLTVLPIDVIIARAIDQSSTPGGSVSSLSLNSKS